MDLSEISVLVVDDNDLIRRTLVSLLLSFGIHSIDQAASAEAGIECLKAAPPDLLMTDWEMGDMSGLDLVHWLRTSPETPNPFLPVMLVTSRSDTDSIRLARDAGIHEYITKPISPAHLHHRLWQLIGRPRPFVRTQTYFGPDRRMPFVGGLALETDRRRTQHA